MSAIVSFLQFYGTIGLGILVLCAAFHLAGMLAGDLDWKGNYK